MDCVYTGDSATNMITPYRSFYLYLSMCILFILLEDYTYEN